MYESFGAVVTGNAVEFRLFLPDAARDPYQYSRGGRPRIQKVQVRGDQSPGPDESRNPRERVVLADLPANPYVPTDPDYCYRIRVRAKRGRFGGHDA